MTVLHARVCGASTVRTAAHQGSPATSPVPDATPGLSTTRYRLGQDITEEENGD
jgi:hypothetical protein